VTGPNGAVGAIEIRVDDLAFFEGEAIARPVNAMLGATTPIMRKLERAAGSAFADKVRPREPLPVGAAVVTNAGDLQVELMVHGVVSSDDEPVTRDTVRLALMSALQRAVAFQIRELAVAPFGLGAGNLDIEDSAEVMLDVIASHMKHAGYPTSIIIFAETELEEEVLRGRLRSRG
jgi:O-acetyl-ADP-ribose deacetylase (regulator of RNase III)